MNWRAVAAVSAVDAHGDLFASVDQVPRSQPLTRAQFEEASKLWPVSFHEDKKISRALSHQVFTPLQCQEISRQLQRARDAGAHSGRLETDDVVSDTVGCVLVDPTTGAVVAQGADDTRSHPLRHATMVAIAQMAQYHVAAEATGFNAGASATHDAGQPPLKRRREARQSVANGAKDAVTDNTRQANGSPYLCSGLDLYTTREPCIMCAMALLHARIGRVFYGSRLPSNGGLGSAYKVCCTGRCIRSAA
eukprot:m.1121184 g.1121184  ORF g.1121184 m.1121184 type:complete len:249 (+) comp24398_c0_seq7:351-1097(+)